MVWKTAGERVLEDSPVRKSGNHELLSSVGTSPDPVIDPYVVLVVPVVPVVVAVVPGVVGVVLLADF